jgi:hypothetical protein
MNPTDPTGSNPTSSGSRVTVAEIAEFLRHLRTLSTSLALDPGRDTTAEQAAFATRKADLFTRIAAAHPELIPAPTAPPATVRPATARPGEGST